MRRRRLRGLVCVGLVLLVGAAGCGVTDDETPRAISDDRLPEGLKARPSTSTTVSGDAVPRTVYYVTGETGETEQRRLEAILREVPVPGGIREVLQALLQPPDEADIGTLIPPDTRLLGDPDLDEGTGTLTIDLSEEFDDIQGGDQAIPYGQIVYTVTDDLAFPDIVRVRFEVAGERRDAPTDEGDLKAVVSRDDYQDFAP